MKVSTIVIPQLLFVAYCMLNTAHAGCNADNCLRALFPTANPTRYSAGSAFCATYTTAINTATTGFPPTITPSCGTSPSRYSSACSCRPTATACAGDAGSIVKNGGFECGTAPWAPAATTGTTFAVAPVGHTGQDSFQVTQVTVPDTSTGLEQASVNQDMNGLLAGKSYVLTFWAFFNNPDAGFVGVKLGGNPVYTVDARDGPGANVWKVNNVPFTPDSATLNLRFEFLFGVQGSVDMIDDVSVAPAA